MPDPLLITGTRIVDGDRVLDDGWIRFEGGAVAGLGTGAPPSHDGPRLDAEGATLVPGFVDVHVHGGGGAEAVDPADVATALDAHRRHGTVRSAVSLVSAPIPVLVEQVRTLAPVVRADPLLLGVHLEGPFLSPDAKGAHDPSALTVPTADAVAALIAAAEGTLAQVTMAPELPGAIEAVRAFVAAGVRVAVGHTTADLATAAAAFDAGATLLTHAFNAMPGLGHRAPGPVGAAVADPRVTLEVIADGHHVDPILVGGLFRLAPGRVALITDAMAAAAAPEGEYRLGSLDVTVRDGQARLPTGSLAGSTLTMDAAVRTTVAAGVSLPEAVAAATSVPARAIGRPDLGALSPGSPADAVLLDDALQVRRVWAGGVPLP